MKIKNIKTNIIFDIPTNEAKDLINENPDLFEKYTKTKTKSTRKKTSNMPSYEQNTCLPLIWEA